MTKLKMRPLKKTGERSFRVLMASLLGAAFVSFAAPQVFAATEVTATVDRDSLNPDDTLTFSVTVKTGDEVTVGNPVMPQLTDFDVINQWTKQEARASFVTTSNGPQFQTVRSLIYNFMLQPKHQGTLHIGAVEVDVDGHKFNTKPISIKVAPGAGGSRPRAQQQQQGGIQMPPGFDEEDDDVFSQLLKRQAPPAVGSRTLPVNTDEAFFVQADVDKTEAYVGEQITASWYLYTRGNIRDLDTLKYPSLKGFWKEDIEIATNLNFTSEIVNGVPYRKALLASFALFPIKEGVSTIDPYQAKCTVVPMDAFGGMGQAFTFTKASAAIKVNVKPLPVDGRPASFTGAVGTFEVTARVEDKNIVENQPFTLKIRFEGQGNAKLIEPPPFSAPDGLEVYDQQNDSKFFRTGTSYKDFSILLIPRHEGDFTIPGMSTSIFDPKTRTYVNKTTEPIHIVVGKGNGTGPGPKNLSLEDTQKKAPAGPQEPQLLPELKPTRTASTAQAAIGYSGLFGLILLTLVWRARTELGWGQKKKDLLRQLRARLRRVDERVAKNDWRGVGIEMTNASYFVLGAISGEGGANVELSKLLAKAPPSVRRELGASLEKQMEVFQVLSFAPETVVGTLKDPAQLKAAVDEMAKLMERAVSLGASAAQSDEYESNPSAS